MEDISPVLMQEWKHGDLRKIFVYVGIVLCICVRCFSEYRYDLMTDETAAANE